MNTRKLFGLFGLGVLILAVFFFYLNKEVVNSSRIERDFPNPVLKTGTLAPDLEITDIEGKTHKLSEYRGKVVLLNFWATWCPPCLAEMPSLEAAYTKLRDQGFEVLAINLDEQPKTVHKLIQEHKLSFKIFLDPQGKAAHAYLVYGLPYTIVLDREGKIQYKGFGGHEWDQGKELEKLKALL
ncbi:MAG: TlpA family protein disulfide reductase [Deltaproteobacteria bacterium]|nr:TlpA family protein disulfide reductase [Deltaproteobacteria bacterium]